MNRSKPRAALRLALLLTLILLSYCLLKSPAQAEVPDQTAPGTSDVRLKLRGTCRGGPPWPPPGRQISYRENQLPSKLPGLLTSTTGPLPPTQDNLALGLNHFDAHCASCHGTDGKAGTEKGKAVHAA